MCRFPCIKRTLHDRQNDQEVQWSRTFCRGGACGKATQEELFVKFCEQQKHSRDAKPLAKVGGDKGKGRMSEWLHGEEPMRAEGPEIVSARPPGGLLAFLQAAQVKDTSQSKTEQPCGPLKGLGEGRSQLGEVPVCTQEGPFARRPLLQRSETSNFGVVAGFPATRTSLALQGLVRQCTSFRKN